jgi:hypothetical protein
MLGACEVKTFLDAVGAWAVAFTPPHENVWAMGVRLLADRIAWERPGALMVHDTEHDAFDCLDDAYRFLFSENDVPPPQTPALTLYTHPKRMPRYRGEGASFETAYAGLRRAVFEAVSPQLSSLVHKDDCAVRAMSSGAEAPWKRTAQLQLDQALTRLGSQDSPARRGALDALARVRDILGSSDA